MSYKFADIKGTKIHYEERGEGSAVVFIHAGIVNLGMWDEQMDAFAEKYQVIRYDMRGWGETARPPGEFSDVADLHGLLQHVGVAQAAIVGCSFGGKTAIDFALVHPEMVSALVLVGAAVGGFDWQAADFGEKDEAMEAAYDRGERELSAELETQIWFDGPGRRPEQVNQEARARVYEMVLSHHQLPEPVESRRLELDPPAIERLEEIGAPALVIVGQEDVEDIRAIGELLKARLPVVEMTVMRDTAHFPNVERPSTFNQLVLDFLEKAQCRSTIYGVLLHETEAKVWLVGDGLPQVTMAGELWDTEPPDVQRPLQHLLGGKIWPLYRATFHKDEATQTTESVYVLENIDFEIANGRWANYYELSTLAYVHKTLIENCWRERETGNVPAQRPPWARPGWVAEATSWIAMQVEERGNALVKPVELVRSWALSCVLRATTAEGIYYFKTVADLPLFVNEAAIVKTLSQLYPRHVPTPLVSDERRDWMLLPELKEMVGWGAPTKRRQAFLVDFGQLQVAAVAAVEPLLAAGCLDRRLAHLPGWIEVLLTSEMVLATMAESERERLTALIPQLQALCQELATYCLPETLMHGDLHGGNIAIQDEDFVYFDWTDACISHPFFDMLNIFLEEDTAVQSQLRNAYLGQWTAFAPMTQLLAAWSVAEILGAVHHAISYWQILANIEPGSHYLLDWALPFWLGRILKLSEGLASGA
jgi:pimeloyl-ACP methyl ester carboxylesterase